MYFLKLGRYYTYIHTYIYHADLEYVYKHILLFTNHFMKKKKKPSRYRCCSNVQNNEDSNAFLVKLLDILVNLFIDL